jgi:hypothetical protein
LDVLPRRRGASGSQLLQWKARSISAGPERRILARIENKPVEEEARDLAAGIRKFGMGVEHVRNAIEGVEFCRHLGITKLLE